MKLNSKELIIIVIDSLIAIFLMILFSKLDITEISPIIKLVLLVGVIILVVVLVFGIIYKRIGEIDKALENQEIKQIELEEKLKRSEQLINIKVDIKDLQRRIKNGKKS